MRANYKHQWQEVVDGQQQKSLINRDKGVSQTMTFYLLGNSVHFASIPVVKVTEM